MPPALAANTVKLMVLRGPSMFKEGVLISEQLQLREVLSKYHVIHIVLSSNF